MKGVDSNVLVRYMARDDPGQERAVTRFIEAARVRAEPIFVNVIVLAELVWVLRSTYQYPRAEVAAVIERVLTTEQFVVEDAHLVWQALSDFQTSKADFADCLIGRKNLRLGCDVTVTFDGRLKGLASFASLPAGRP